MLRVGAMLDYKMPYHVIKEEDSDVFTPKLSFKSYEDAVEFVKFAHSPNLLIVRTKELKDYYLGLEYKNHEF